MRYERTYYYDEARHTGASPTDEGLGIHAAYSPQVQRLAVKLAALLPYAEAEELMAELAQVPISDSTIWQHVQEAGEAANAYLAVCAQEHTALPNPDQISPGIATTAAPMGVSLDGAKFNVRGEGWKEAKIGTIFHFAATGATRPTHTSGERVDVVRATDISYVFHFGPADAFGTYLWAEADRRAWLAARQKAVLGDGAPWIWKLADWHFADATPIVDWYHAKQHLWDAAHLLYGMDGPQAAAFVKRHEDHLYQGQVDHIARAITRTDHSNHRTPGKDLLRREAAYFTDNRARMTYQQFQRDKLPIGSGTVESGCKQFKDRFAQAGMRWSRDGATHLMPFRAAVMGKLFNSLWSAACH